MTTTQELEKKIARDGKIIVWLFAALMLVLAGELVSLIVTAYIVVHHK